MSQLYSRSPIHHKQSSSVQILLSSQSFFICHISFPYYFLRSHTPKDTLTYWHFDLLISSVVCPWCLSKNDEMVEVVVFPKGVISVNNLASVIVIDLWVVNSRTKVRTRQPISTNFKCSSHWEWSAPLPRYHQLPLPPPTSTNSNSHSHSTNPLSDSTLLPVLLNITHTQKNKNWFANTEEITVNTQLPRSSKL